MQTFYDKIFVVEGKKDPAEDWKLQLTQVEVEDLSIVEESTRGWFVWGE